MTTKQDIIIVENLDPSILFAGEGKELDALLNTVEKHVESLHHDISTASGRSDLKSFVRKIASAKNVLDKIGKDHVDLKKKELRFFDSNRKRAKDFLQMLQDEKRKPLTDWEAEEEKRVQDIVDRIEAIKDLVPSDVFLTEITIDDIKTRIDKLKNLVIDRGSFDELEPVASAAKEDSLRVLTSMHDRLAKQAEEKAELDRLRTAQVVQDQKDHDERIRKEAEDKAKADVEQEKIAVKEKAEQDARDAIEAVEKEKREAIADKEKAKQAEQKAKQDAKDAIEAVERQKAAAEQREKDAKIEADKQAAKAAKDERDKIAAQQKAAGEEIARRWRDTKHKGRINRAIVTSLVQIMGCTETQAKKAVTEIAKRKIPNITINY